MSNGFLTIQEVADHLRVHYMTVRRWIISGELQHFKIGRQYRIKTTDLHEFMGITDKKEAQSDIERNR